jgi:hypothetical protein
VATALLGYSERAAQKHDWQVTDEDFKKRAQISVQQGRARGRAEVEPARKTPLAVGSKPLFFPRMRH